jgi:hypothetical protein
MAKRFGRIVELFQRVQASLRLLTTASLEIRVFCSGGR